MVNSLMTASSIRCGKCGQQNVDHCDHENSHYEQIVGSFVTSVPK